MSESPMVRRIYDEAMYRFGEREPSYWEANARGVSPGAAPFDSDEQCDIAVIGGGYTGLSAAYHLCRDGQLDVRVLEAGHVGWGASGRNGGFCSIGGEGLGAEKMVDRYGLDGARDYYRSQVEAVGLVRDLVVDEAIDVERHGNAELAIACSPGGFAELKAHAEFQYRALGLDVSVIGREAFRERYFDSPLQHGGKLLRPTFGLHPLNFVRGLAVAAEKRGAIIHAHSEVSGWARNGGRHQLTVNGHTLRAKRVVLACNGFAPEHLHRSIAGRVLPMISSIIVTRPLTDDELAAQAWVTDAPSITSLRLLNYFRLLPDRRFLFGGRGSADGSEDSAAKNYRQLTARFHEIFPAWREVGIDYRWHGLVCMTRRMTPAIGRLEDDPTVFFGFGYHGNGVNTATWAGKQLADWIAEADDRSPAPPDWLPVAVRGLPDRFPFSGLRLRYVQAAIAMLRIADRYR